MHARLVAIQYSDGKQGGGAFCRTSVVSGEQSTLASPGGRRDPMLADIPRGGTCTLRIALVRTS